MRKYLLTVPRTRHRPACTIKGAAAARDASTRRLSGCYDPDRDDRAADPAPPEPRRGGPGPRPTGRNAGSKPPGRRRGMTQRELAEPRYTKAYVSALEKGLIKPSLAALRYLARRLGTVPEAFLADADTQWQRIDAELRLAAGDWQSAADRFREILETEIQGAGRGLSLLGLAEASYRLGRGREVIALATEARRAPRGGEPADRGAPGGLLARGRAPCHRRSGSCAGCCTRSCSRSSDPTPTRSCGSASSSPSRPS